MPTTKHLSPRVAVAGLLHESNSFFAVPTRESDFVRIPIAAGETLLDAWARNHDEVAGFVLGGRDAGLDLVPIFSATATPGGPVDPEAFESLTAELTAGLRSAISAGGLDGVLLALHGAMYCTAFPHADGEILKRVRQTVGPDLPLVVTHDFHANVSQEAIEHSTALIGYQTNPHVDQKARGFKAAQLMGSILLGGVRPSLAMARPGMLYNIRFQNTNRPPLAPITEESRRLEREGQVLAATVFGGYQYADVPAMGASVVVVTDSDPEAARRHAEALAGMLRRSASQLQLDLPDPARAVELAIRESRTPVVLAEMGDNIGGGSPGDSTAILAELLRQRATGWVVALYDPEAVKVCASAGVGQPVEFPGGGKTDDLHGSPVTIRGEVRSLHDGRFIEPEIRHGGRRYHDQGLTAVVRVEGSTPDLENLLVLNSRRQMPFTLHQLISLGIYPERQRILVAKAAVAFRAAYEPIAGTILEVDSPGVTAVNPKRFRYRNAPPDLLGM